MQFYLKYSKEKIKLADKPFAGGGEGNLYKIISPKALSGYVAKIYHPEKINTDRQKKIHYLYQNPPKGLQEGQHPAFIWVKDVLYDDQKNFKGFIMPFIQGEKLEVLSYAKMPKHLGPEWKRFDLRDQNSFDLRLRICFNLAAALYHIHATQHYVVVDLKPENVIIQPNGLVSLVDMDSVEVVEDDKVIFPAPVATPEYSPPEHYRNESRSHQLDGIDTHWDMFALAVIFYKLLFGIHPYTGSAKAPYDNAVSLHEKIEHGLFVHHPAHPELFQVIPPPHKAFEKLPEEMKQLFQDTFVAGHSKPELRPIAEQWCMGLLQTLGDEKMLAFFQNLFNENPLRSRTLRQPSIVTGLPKIALEKEALIPNDYHRILEWVPPSPTPKLPTKPEKLKLTINKTSVMIGSIFLSIGLVVGFFFISPWFYNWFFGGLWELSTFQTTLYLQLMLLFPMIIFPAIFTGSRFIFDKKIKAWRRLNRIATNIFNNFDQEKEKFHRLKEGIKTTLAKTLESLSFQKSEQEAQRNFKNWLQEQDELYKQVMEKEKIALELLLQKHVEKLCLHPASKDLKAGNFQEIKTFVQLEKDKLLAKKDIQVPDQVEILKIPELSTKIMRLKQAVVEEEKNYLTSLEQQLYQFQQQTKKDLGVLDQRLIQMADLEVNNSPYFKLLTTDHRLLLDSLHQNGLKNLLDIDSFDFLSSNIVLKNEKIISLATKDNSTLLGYFFSTLSNWHLEILQFQQKINDEKLRLQQKLQQAEREAEFKKEAQLKFFEEQRKKIDAQLPVIYLEFIKEQELQSLLELEEALAESETTFEEEREKMQAEFEKQYQEILDHCAAVAEEKQLELDELVKLKENEAHEKISLAGLEDLKKEGLQQIKKLEKVATEAEKAEENYLRFIP